MKLLMIIAQTCLNHLLNHWVCLNIDGLWIVGVGCNVWCELWSFGVFVKNDHDYENLNW